MKSLINKLGTNYLFHVFSTISENISLLQQRNCYSIFGIKDLVEHEKQPDTFSIAPIQSADHEMAVSMVKRYFLSDHVFVRARRMDLNNDRAIDEYIIGLIKQGNSMFAKTYNDIIAGFTINFAASAVDLQNLRNYAFYRQDPDTKEFMYYIAKLQETPNFWNIFNEDKVFEIKMLAVLPEYRRQGLATMLVQKSKILAKDQGYKTIRMDCINPYDYKIAERCMLSCLVKFPLHKLRGTNSPFIKKSSQHNTCVRVFVKTTVKHDSPNMKQIDIEKCISSTTLICPVHCELTDFTKFDIENFTESFCKCPHDVTCHRFAPLNQFKEPNVFVRMALGFVKCPQMAYLVYSRYIFIFFPRLPFVFRDELYVTPQINILSSRFSRSEAFKDE